MDWSPQQQGALDAVGRWLHAKDKPFFYLAGFAGTGKTTLAVHLAEGEDALFAAYTGKAASVMRKKGCSGAGTIHSLIYKPREKGVDRLVQLERELEQVKALPEPEAEFAARLHRGRIAMLEREIAEERLLVRQPSFTLNMDSELRDASLLVLDECSMVGGVMVDDLLSFQVPILVLGDPFQLPPVKAAGFFTKQTPDFQLDEIHRQARDNPIIDIATRIRTGEALPFGAYGESAVMAKEEFDQERLTGGVQVLVGRNATRHRNNAWRRKRLGFTEPLPVAGDRLVCRRNNRDLGLLNGTIWTVLANQGAGDFGPYLHIRSEDDGLEQVVEAHRGPFVQEDVPSWGWKEADQFEFGYALTVHSAQGSQYDDVVVVDESACFGADVASKWRYTSVTRATTKVTVLR